MGARRTPMYLFGGGDAKISSVRDASNTLLMYDSRLTIYTTLLVVYMIIRARNTMHNTSSYSTTQCTSS